MHSGAELLELSIIIMPISEGYDTPFCFVSSLEICAGVQYTQRYTLSLFTTYNFVSTRTKYNSFKLIN